MKGLRKMALMLTPLAVMTAVAGGGTFVVKQVRHAGPMKLIAPVVMDSTNATQTKYSADKMIDMAVDMDLAARNASLTELNSLRLDSATMNVMEFDINAATYVKGLKPEIKGTKKCKWYADGKAVQGDMNLQPGFHRIGVKFIADSAAVEIIMPTDKVSATADGKRRTTMADVLSTKITRKAQLSPSGKWAMVQTSWYDDNYKSQGETWLIDLKTGRKRLMGESAQWMPATDRYCYIDTDGDKKTLKMTDPQTGEVRILARDIHDWYYTISPTEDFAILQQKQEGPKKEDGVFEIVHPDDRQPGWRTRYSLAKLDFNTGMVTPLTYTWRPVSLHDITPDGQHILFAVYTDSLTQRPTTRASFYDMNLATMETRQIVDKDGFVGGAIYAGSKDKVIFTASTEAFGGVGKRVPEGRTPSMYDYHLYLMDTPSKKVTPLTADDATSIEDVEWSPVEGCVYYTAQNGDSVSLYRMDMKSLKSRKVSQPLEVVGGLSVAVKGGNVMVHGSSMTVPYEVYEIASPGKGGKPRLVMAPNKQMYEHIALGTVKPWRFMTERGYEVTGFYNLPADFDPDKKYPVIVHYYGGCSPTSRRFGNGSHYPVHYWNALGYIVFTVNPSGASGFGQEWASRHVNTMGEGPAQDIIDATRQFAKDIKQVDADHIGCVSASYGGFMTQYMMTKDNPFACGVSHAGISDHTSYWGEGYWGYSYSETSAANSYPWTRKDLFVDRSPLYNADKIKKPILFTHGTADTNVPVGESIQMFTALKLLGVPTAFVEVEGENHGIMDPTKRVKWINTMVAWFDKYLKNDSSWWNEMYGPKNL